MQLYAHASRGKTSISGMRITSPSPDLYIPPNGGAATPHLPPALFFMFASTLSTSARYWFVSSWNCVSCVSQQPSKTG